MQIIFSYPLRVYYEVMREINIALYLTLIISFNNNDTINSNVLNM